MESSTLTIFIAAVAGYLAGSVSGARIVARRVGAGDLSRTKVVLDGTGSAVEAGGVSASSLQARGGGKAGVPAGLIDIAKAVLPALIARLLWPDGPEHVVAGLAAIVGHVFPLYHRFVGGYGISPLLGALAVIDIRAPVLTIAVFAVIGLIVGSAFVGIELWPLGLIPYFIWLGDVWTVTFAVIAASLYFWRSWSEMVGALRSFQRDPRPWRERIGDFKKYPDYEVPDA